MFDSLFGRNPRRQGQTTSSFWRIDLRSLGGPITALARVALNLPQKSPKPRRGEAPRPVAAPAAGEQRPRPQRDPRRDHPQQTHHAQRDYEQRDPRQPAEYEPHDQHRSSMINSSMISSSTTLARITARIATKTIARTIARR